MKTNQLAINIINLIDSIIDSYYDVYSRRLTTGEVEVFDLFPNDLQALKDAKKYQPVRTRVLKSALKDFSQIADPKEFQFFDIGCGKGRTAYWSHQFGFQSYLGVDISKPLIKQAVSNQIDEHYDQYVCENILHYKIEERDTVFFMFNPFGGETFRFLLEKFTKHQGDSYLIYVNPILDFLISLKPQIKLIQSRSFLNVNNNYCIYKIS